jgi:type II secretory pathway component GspD/PulD (secretin)
MSARQLTAFICSTTLLWSGLVSAALAQSSGQAAFASEAGPQAAEVAIEVRIIGVPESFLDRMHIEIHHEASVQGKQKAASGVTFFNDVQVGQFMEAAQGDARTNITMAPRLTLEDRQTSGIKIGASQRFLTGIDVRWTGENMMFVPRNEERFLGLQLKVQPVVSADRRFVRLKFKAEDSLLDSAVVPLSPVSATLLPVNPDGSKGQPVPFTQYIQQPRISTVAVEKTLCLPDGGTALVFAGTRISEGPDQFGPPVLSKIPYLTNLFRASKIGSDRECVLFMVTPRIVIDEREEERATGD